MWLGVNWGAFVSVFVTALVATTIIVTCYAAGLRLLAVGHRDAGPDSVAGTAPDQRPVGATIGAVVCFAISVAAVLYGLYLVIPEFHS